MAKENPTRIQLKGPSVWEEGRAAAAITPGMLVALDADEEVIPHGTAGGNAENAFALEDALQGRTIEDDYAVGELVFYAIQRPGDVVYGWLASGQTVDPSTPLASNGDGTLREAGAGEPIVGYPLDAVDLSDSGAENARIRVRIA